MLQIDLWTEAQDFLDGLSVKHRRQVVEKIFALAADPLPVRSKQLEGYAPLRRLKSGEYRIIYFVEGELLRIPLIDRRGDDKIYRRIERKFRS